MLKSQCWFRLLYIVLIPYLIVNFKRKMLICLIRAPLVSWTKVLIMFAQMKNFQKFVFQQMHNSVNSLTVPYHCEDIGVFYNDIILALKTSGTNCTPMSKSDKTSTFRPQLDGMNT